MPEPLYYVGTSAEVAHHAQPLSEAFDVRIVGAGELAKFARAGDVCVFFNEYFPRFRDACLEAKAKGCATLYAIDGILEWRNSWELSEQSGCCLWVMRPVLSHKAACIGRSQARVLESWGNLGKCEVVGVPRFDRLTGRRPRARSSDDPFRVLVVTAKCPGFNPEQIARTTSSLRHLKQWFEQHPQIGGAPVEPVWRITYGLEQEIGVENQLHDTTGKDIASVLETVDAVIATPSTVMLEGMLQGLPVALLDYNNRPHYVPAAWRITAQAHFDEIVPQLAQPAAALLLYQESILSDALERRTPATPRLVELIHSMRRIARDCLSRGQSPSFPRRILADPQAGHHLPEETYDHAKLFPPRLLFAGAGRDISSAEAVALAAREGLSISLLNETPPTSHVPALDTAGQASSGTQPNFQTKAPGWDGILNEVDASWQRRLSETADRLQLELALAHREIERLKRRTIPARLKRLAGKVTRLLRKKAA